MTDNRIKNIHSIRDEGGGEWFVYLKPGYHLDGAHCFGEDSREACLKTMRRVKPCNCPDCRPSPSQA